MRLINNNLVYNDKAFNVKNLKHLLQNCFTDITYRPFMFVYRKLMQSLSIKCLPKTYLIKSSLHLKPHHISMTKSQMSFIPFLLPFSMEINVKCARFLVFRLYCVYL